MPRPKGTPKSGGRKKGLPNKSIVELERIASKLGVNPFEVLLHFANGDWEALGYDREKFVSAITDNGPLERWTIDPAVRSKSAAEACQYLHPKRKAIELSGEVKNPVSELSNDELDRRIQSLLKGKNGS